MFRFPSLLHLSLLAAMPLLAASQAAVPVNDNFADRTTLTGAAFTAAGTTSDSVLAVYTVSL